ncbi:MAG: hypothetical protein JSW21_13090 [Gammaproteobacteria bacterium]|nr:MAG: hypothetical protein JSW21_13090 [Gammaproteobacteria bacterium]
MGFGDYIRTSSKVVLAVSLAAGLLLGLLVLLAGEGDVNLALEIESRNDAIWILVGLPLIALLTSLLLTPLSYLLYRLIFRGG